MKCHRDHSRFILVHKVNLEQLHFFTNLTEGRIMYVFQQIGNDKVVKIVRFIKILDEQIIN